MMKSKIIAVLASLLGISVAAEAITAPTRPDNVATLPLRRVRCKNANKQVYNGSGSVLVVPNRVLNQKQYRKLVKSNPSLLKSKKHRSKN